MRRRSEWAIAATLLTFFISAVLARPIAARRALYTLHFPPGIDLSSVQGLRLGSRASGRDVVFETSVRELARGRLKFLLFVPGYRLVRMEIDLTRDVHEANIALTPLPPIHVTGHIVPGGADLDGAGLRCTMLVTLPPDSNGVVRIDGYDANFDLGTRKVSAADRYAFAIDLPDAVNDPLLAGPGDADFAFAAQPREGRPLFLWHTDWLVTPAMASYPSDFVLSPKKSKRP